MPAHRSSRHRAPTARRLQAVIWAAAVAILTATGMALASMSGGGEPRAGAAAASPCPRISSVSAGSAASAASGAPAAGHTGCPHRAAAGTGSSPATAKTTVARSTVPARHRLSPTPSPRPSSTSPLPSAGAQQGPATQQVLAVINKARSQAGLAPLSPSTGLERSAAAHNLVMAGGCGLSHQCPGEPAFGDRETAAGVHWTEAGENIGDGGPVPDSPGAIARMAVSLTQDMLNEKPPHDGHRKNILSPSFRYIGVAVYRDSSGTVWMTQDFAN